MAFELSAEHEDLPPQRPRVRRRRDRAARRPLGPRALLPGRRRAPDGRARPVRADRRPRSTAAAAGDFTSLCVAIEEIGRVDQSLGITVEAAVGLGINPILTFGTEEQKQRWLPDLVAGRALAGFGLTEPESGSDAGATTTRAVLDGGEWVIDGPSSSSPTRAPRSRPASPSPRGPARRGRARRDLGDHRAVGNARLHRRAGLRQARLARVRHPSADVRRLPRARGSSARASGARASRSSSPRSTTVGSPSPPWRSAASGLPRAVGRTTPASGRLRRPDRPQAGRRVPDRRPRGHGRGRAAARYKAAAQGRRRLGGRGQAGRPVAKLYATEAAVTATRIATQVFGGYGFMEEYPVARFYRDAKILEIGEGTSEVQRMLIARSLGLPVE